MVACFKFWSWNLARRAKVVKSFMVVEGKELMQQMAKCVALSSRNFSLIDITRLLWSRYSLTNFLIFHHFSSCNMHLRTMFASSSFHCAKTLVSFTNLRMLMCFLMCLR